RNDTYGAGGRGDITPQGYMLASASKLIMPSGRIAPAVFDRADGRMLFALQGGRALSGGTYAMLSGDRLYNGTQLLTAYNLEKTAKDKYGRDVPGPVELAYFGVRRIVTAGGVAYVATEGELLAIPEGSLPAAAERVDAVRKLRWENRNAFRSYDRLRGELAALEAGSPRRKQIEAEIEQLIPTLTPVVTAGKELDSHLDRVCKWRLPCRASDSLILAGRTLYAGGDGKVIAVDADSGRELWWDMVSGTARGLAVANGRLFVSTTRGHIKCFSPRRRDVGREITEDIARELAARPLGSWESRKPPQRPFLQLAKSILDETKVRRGYGLVLGPGADQLAGELARRTEELNLYVIEPDALKAARARASSAHFHGSRVTVQCETLELASYPKYFANLVVCLADGGRIAAPPEQVLRVLKPEGGVAYVARSEDWLRRLDRAGLQVHQAGEWVRIVRGALPGAGEWSHQYADAGNTACSGDRLATGPFGVLWFGRPGPRDVIDRHSRGPAPLSVAGRLFIEGPGVLMAYDAYNGVLLWQRRIEGAQRSHVSSDCSNIAATADSLFVAVDDKCLRLDAATGLTCRTYPVPPRQDGRKRWWGWLATTGGVLFGSRTETDRPFKSWPDVSGNTSEGVFAVDVETGKARWLHEGRGILHPSIAVGDGAVFLVDRAVTERQRRQAVAERVRDPGEKDAPRLDRKGRPVERDVRLVVALNAATGAELWATPLDLTDCIVPP
ncbi:MAG: PQQ-binding-like beta-propeller repeat protein, partial [Phycisphaerae bacterium]